MRSPAIHRLSKRKIHLNELNIILESVNPAVLWGAQNEHFEILKQHFPKLRIVARGNEVKVFGDDQAVETFKGYFDRIVTHAEQHHNISLRDIEAILATDSRAGKSTREDAASTGKDGGQAGSEAIVFGPSGLIVKARTPNQRRMVESIHTNDILFAIGPAGTGKTYTAVALAVRALRNKEVKRIILTRPAVEAGESLGFLPGDMKEKVDPYLRPLYDALDDMVPPERLKLFLENRTIEVAPLAFMRGRTLDNCFVILDEAQNATDMQLKMFLTRMGPTAKFIVTGDITQIDLPKKQQSGLQNAIKLLEGIDGIDIIHLSGGDVVRHKLVRRILEAYGDI